MSCDIVSDLTVSAIVCAMAGTEYGAAGLHDENDGTFYSAATCSQKVGQMLLDANFASVNERYDENVSVRVFKMKSKPDGDPFTLGERYGCITSYENQTCAAPGYNESEIHCVLSHVKDDLAEKMIVRLGEQPSGGL